MMVALLAGLLLIGRRSHVGATPLGVMELLDEYRIATAGARAVVVGDFNTIKGKDVKAARRLFTLG